MTPVAECPAADRALAALRRAGNPFRNYFARNPDDDTCSRYHVPELFAPERDQLLGVVDLYRHDPTTLSEVVPVLGNKGAGKTHLLYSIKHGGDGGCQLVVTPGVYQKDTDFLEFLLFQTVDTLLGGSRQRGVRPLEAVGDQLTRRLLAAALTALPPVERSGIIPAHGLNRLTRLFGMGGLSGEQRVDELAAALTAPSPAGRETPRVRRLLGDVGLEPARAYALACEHVRRTESHNTAGLMRRAIFQGFCKATLLGDEADLALFLTNGFAELPFNVRPTRQDLVLALFKVLVEIFRGLKLPVVVAFDQLEDLLLARRADDGRVIAETFFAGVVQAMHQLNGLCFLVFAERGLWNRFVPSLDGYIRDRLNNPVHVPRFGTLNAVRLESPDADLVLQVVEARLRPVLAEVPDAFDLPPTFPFSEEQVLRVARTEPTLRDMLIQFRHLFDKLVFDAEAAPEPPANRITEPAPEPVTIADDTLVVTAVDVVADPSAGDDDSGQELSTAAMLELWEQERRVARRKLEPEGALTGATRELQSALGTLLQVCHEHGVKVGPWRLQHVVGEWSFGEHPTYGALTLAHWSCKDGQPWKVGIGLFLGRGGGKPKDLEVKLAAMEIEPAVVDHLILLRPDDDLSLTGKSKTLWADAERRGRHARLEAVGLDELALLASLPRWLAALSDALPPGCPLPNLADIIQDKCERLLEQVCMPVQG
jgi:hypothetical protein